MLDIIFYLVGVIVCVAGGFSVTGIFVGLSINLIWKRLKDVHTLGKLIKVIRENKIGERE